MQSKAYDSDYHREAAMQSARKLGTLDGLAPAAVCALDAIEIRNLNALQVRALMGQA
jgi:hypothetical protein